MIRGHYSAEPLAEGCHLVRRFSSMGPAGFGSQTYVEQAQELVGMPSSALGTLRCLRELSPARRGLPKSTCG